MPTQNKVPWEFPSGLVVRTWCFHCRGLGSIPGQEAQILQATHSVAKTNNKSKALCGENARVEETRPPLSRVKGLPASCRVADRLADAGHTGSKGVEICSPATVVYRVRIFVAWTSQQHNLILNCQGMFNGRIPTCS